MMSTSEEEAAMKQLADAGFLDHDPANPPVITPQDTQWASEQLRSMIDLADRTITAWVANTPGDKVFGKVVDISEVESDFQKGKMVPLVTIETPTSRLVQVFCWHTVLCNEVQRQMKRGSLVIGSDIVVAYTGQVASKGQGNPTEMYRVVSRPAV
jgi:hypothetical protein